MGESLTKFVERFAENQLLAYFLMLWGAAFFFSATSRFMWLMEGYGSTLDVMIDSLWNFADLGCAVILVLLGLKILNKLE